MEVVTRYEKTLIFPYFLRLPRSAKVVTQVVTYVVTYSVTVLDHDLSFCRLICILFLLYLNFVCFICRMFDFLKNFVPRKDPFTTEYRNFCRQNQTIHISCHAITRRRHLKRTVRLTRTHTIVCSRHSVV